MKLANENFFYLEIPFQKFSLKTYFLLCGIIYINKYVLVTTKFGNALNNNLWDKLNKSCKSYNALFRKQGNSS